MSGSTENKTEDDVEMADAPDAEEDLSNKKASASGKVPRFEIKKWNAVVSIFIFLLHFWCGRSFM
jgi:hypothetical protein